MRVLFILQFAIFNKFELLFKIIVFVIDFYFLIGYRQCGLNEFSIKVKYILELRPINFSTEIMALAIDLLDKNNIKNHWNFSVLVPNK